MSESLTIPSNWSWKPLKDLARVVSGGTPSRENADYWNGTIPWATPSDITKRNGLFLFQTAELITDKGLNSSSANLLPAGSVLMTSRATLGESKIATCAVATNQGFKSLIPNAGVNNLYLLYQMQFRKEQYALRGIGTTFLEVNKSDTENFPLPVPATVKEQAGIADVLSTLDEQIEATEALIEKLAQRRKGLVQEHLLPAAATASTVALGDVCSVITSGSRGWAQYYATEGDLFLRIGNLTRAHPNLRFDDVVLVKPPSGGEGQRTRLEAGDVLISITADLGIIGCIPENLGTAYINQHIALARLSDADLDPRWVAHVLASPFGSEQISKLNDGGAKAGLNLPTINALRVPKPSLDTQKDLAALLDAADDEIASEQALAMKLRLQKQGLMRDLLTGKTRVLQ